MCAKIREFDFQYNPNRYSSLFKNFNKQGELATQIYDLFESDEQYLYFVYQITFIWRG